MKPTKPVQKVVTSHSAYVSLWGRSDTPSMLPDRYFIRFLVEPGHRRQLFRVEDRVKSLFPSEYVHPKVAAGW